MSIIMLEKWKRTLDKGENVCVLFRNSRPKVFCKKVFLEI